MQVTALDCGEDFHAILALSRPASQFHRSLLNVQVSLLNEFLHSVNAQTASAPSEVCVFYPHLELYASASLSKHSGCVE